VLGEPPAAREGHTATLAGRKIYFLYGCSSSSFMDDMVVLDMDNLEWSRPALLGDQPSPRFGHTATLVNDHEIWSPLILQLFINLLMFFIIIYFHFHLLYY
jgi:hypothetical protein